MKMNVILMLMILTKQFVTTPLFVALVSEDSNEPVYILKVQEKGISEKEETDGYGHVKRKVFEKGQI